ncbi:class I SAM-dependent methyltransferase [Methanothrix soehngenii]|uniref:class I SAM-dependent methyltransferase n=1 Tax=Methanothrix soehngenii TaxID=2223 RepID=UPI00300C7334
MWVEQCYEMVLGRKPCAEDVSRVLASGVTKRQLLVQLISSAEFTDILWREAIDHHQAIVHNTRIKLIKFMLPPANTILDIGGANGSLIEYGYSYNYKKLIITDLPPEDRIAELRAVNLSEKWKDNPKVTILYDLSKIPDASIDLVWAGQLIEHIEKDELPSFLQEVHRILKTGGTFHLDTPNAIMARIQSSELLHPEHKYEYRPDDLEKILSKYFKVCGRLGLIPMPISHENKVFSYQEMVLNNSFSDNLEHSYIIYFACKK